MIDFNYTAPELLPFRIQEVLDAPNEPHRIGGVVYVPEGGGECVPHGEWESISQSQEVRHVFCECGHELGMDERDSWPFKSTRLFAMPNYCQECGRKIRKAVKR